MATALSHPSVTSSTNLGPMTTPLTFIPECMQNLYDFSTDGLGVPWTYYTQGCALSTCCPYKKPYTTAWAWYTTYYSPAVCPYGYQTCSAPPIITPGPQETVAWCCPSAYTCPEASWAQGPAESASSVSYNIFCQKQEIISTSAFAVDNLSAQNIVSVEAVLRYYYVAYPLQIRWKTGDFPTAAASSTTMSTSLLPASTASSTAPSSTSASSVSATPALVLAPGTSTPTGSSTGNVSNGAIAAIATVIGAILLVAIVALVWWLRNKAKRQAEAGHGLPYVTHEAEGWPTEPVLVQVARAELPVRDLRRELEGGGMKFELSGEGGVRR